MCVPLCHTRNHTYNNAAILHGEASAHLADAAATANVNTHDTPRYRTKNKQRRRPAPNACFNLRTQHRDVGTAVRAERALPQRSGPSPHTTVHIARNQTARAKLCPRQCVNGCNSLEWRGNTHINNTKQVPPPPRQVVGRHHHHQQQQTHTTIHTPCNVTATTTPEQTMTTTPSSFADATTRHQRFSAASTQQ